ncbi:MAG: CRISPR system precrRNA processing endoribonuclease RAMP protein Cas6 [Ktedonobacteraceae bacterium]
MYFVALLLTLRGRDERSFCTPEEQHGISLALLRLLCRADVSLHEEQITVALLKSERQGVLARLTLLAVRADMPTTLLNLITSQSPLQLGARTYEVEAIDLVHPLWAGVGTWADVFPEKSGNFMRFSLATPLITREPGHSRNHDALPFPEPPLLFSHLFSRWQELAGPPLPCDEKNLVHASGCMISDYRLYTVPVKKMEHPLIGYLGWLECEYRTRNTATIVSLNALARLAFFTGIGYLAGQGMGVTSIKIS